MAHNDSTAARRVIVLGSTGSIGVNTLTVIEHLNALAAPRAGAERAPFAVVGLAAGRNVDLLITQARKFAVPAVAIADVGKAALVQRELPHTRVYSGDDAARQLVADSSATDVMAAVVGSAGLPATLEAARRGMTIGLANKETLVAAGELVTPLVKRNHAQLIPVDSEHSAIYQCLAGQPHKSVKRIVLTASGGPFRTVDKETMANATVEQALKHPTWTMGRKITIDSASMMNKSLEVIEAHWLFGLPAEQIDVIIHPQSVVHSFVEFTDHSILAQLGTPDMKTPIQYALTYPDRVPGCSSALDWRALSRLDFETPDMDKFRGLRLAYHVVRTGGTSGAIFNAANEAAVAAFLEQRIRFGRIVELADAALTEIQARPVDSLETVLDADRRARELVDKEVAAACR